VEGRKGPPGTPGAVGLKGDKVHFKTFKLTENL